MIQSLDSLMRNVLGVGWGLVSRDYYKCFNMIIEEKNEIYYELGVDRCEKTPTHEEKIEKILAEGVEALKTIAEHLKKI